MFSKYYPAKLLLWGEHIVIHGAQALATPLHALAGHWVELPAGDEERLLPFLSYLQREGWDALLDLDAFARSITAGLVFASAIPHGYGLGSSGALCAAIYDTFARDKIEPHDTHRYLELKTMLGKMESFSADQLPESHRDPGCQGRTNYQLEFARIRKCFPLFFIGYRDQAPGR